MNEQQEQDWEKTRWLVSQMEVEGIPFYHDVSEVFKVSALVLALQNKGIPAEHAEGKWILSPNELPSFLFAIKLHGKILGPKGEEKWKALAQSQLNENRGSLGVVEILNNRLDHYSSPNTDFRNQLYGMVFQAEALLDQRELHQSAALLSSSKRSSPRL